MRAPANGIELEYETFGDPDDPPLLLVMGLGAQMIWIHPDFCQDLVDRGFFVIRFDNRDVGLSTRITDHHIDVLASITGLLHGDDVEAPYTLLDMAADAWGLCDHLGLDRVHLFGVSLGGMIVQQMAIDRPGSVASLTSVMSTTGDPDVGQPTPEAGQRAIAAHHPVAGDDDRHGILAHRLADQACALPALDAGGNGNAHRRGNDHRLAMLFPPRLERVDLFLFMQIQFSHFPFLV
jgi:pimeloyl-ACP methyl ester carboxylesterase